MENLPDLAIAIIDLALEIVDLDEDDDALDLFDQLERAVHAYRSELARSATPPASNGKEVG